MIHIEDLNKYFGDLHAVADVSLDVMKGEVVGLLGPNGAGKTTTMRIITGYLRPDGGTVTIDGFPVGDEDLKTKSLIGYLPENAPLYHDMEVTEFLKAGENTLEVIVYNTLANHYQTIPSRYRGVSTSGLIGPVRLLSRDG